MSRDFSFSDVKLSLCCERAIDVLNAVLNTVLATCTALRSL